MAEEEHAVGERARMAEVQQGGAVIPRSSRRRRAPRAAHRAHAHRVRGLDRGRGGSGGEVIPPTRRGYAFDECASALQKAIRRGQEEDAVYWALELAESGYDKYAWRRVFVILSEDVGLAWPEGPATIWALHQMALHLQAAARGRPAGRCSSHAVMLLCRARKVEDRLPRDDRARQRARPQADRRSRARPAHEAGPGDGSRPGALLPRGRSARRTSRPASLSTSRICPIAISSGPGRRPSGVGSR